LYIRRIEIGWLHDPPLDTEVVDRRVPDLLDRAKLLAVQHVAIDVRQGTDLVRALHVEGDDVGRVER
jgi:hypothetical protein